MAKFLKSAHLCTLLKISHSYVIDYKFIFLKYGGRFCWFFWMHTIHKTIVFNLLYLNADLLLKN